MQIPSTNGTDDSISPIGYGTQRHTTQDKKLDYFDVGRPEVRSAGCASAKQMVPTTLGVTAKEVTPEKNSLGFKGSRPKRDLEACRNDALMNLLESNKIKENNMRRNRQEAALMVRKGGDNTSDDLPNTRAPPLQPPRAPSKWQPKGIVARPSQRGRNPPSPNDPTFSTRRTWAMSRSDGLCLSSLWSGAFSSSSARTMLRSACYCEGLVASSLLSQPSMTIFL